MRYFEESYADIINDIKELLPKHYSEAVLYSDKIPLDPAYDIYELLYVQGAARFFTCRDDSNKLIAYIIVIVTENLQSSATLIAKTDMIYVSPEHRHTSVVEDLIRTAENTLKSEGVSMMVISFLSSNPCRSLMDKLEFDKSDVTYTKLLMEK